MLQHGSISSALLLTLLLVSWPCSGDSLPEVFTAVISGMDCSLFLITRGQKVDTGRSSVQCITNQTVFVSSAIVINDNTDHIFKLKLKAKVKKTKLIKGVLLPVPTDLNLATKSIQHQGPADKPVDLVEVVKQLMGLKTDTSSRHNVTVNCTYQEPGEVEWTPCQDNGIRVKTLRLRLVSKSKPRGCFKYRAMSSKCEGGSRGYQASVASNRRNSNSASEDTKKVMEVKTEGVFVAGYQISIPSEDTTTETKNRAALEDVQSVSPGIIVEGDIRLPSAKETNKNALLGPAKWPGNMLYYEFDGTVSFNDRSSINVALGLLQSKLGQCFKFVQRNWGNRVKVKSLIDGCWAEAGYRNGLQELNLQSGGCVDNGRIQHEFLHSAGVMHEQSRTDRHLYVNYFEQNVKCPDGPANVKTCKRHNFNTYSVSQISHYGLPYDYLSVMHYEKDAFSNGNGDTLQAKDPYWTDKIGQRVGVSLGDVQLVQRHYGCPVVVQWEGKWGSFPSSPTFCPAGSFVYGYRVRSESDQGGGDDTALNDMELFCRKPNSFTVTRKIWSDYRSWGSWSSDTYCSGTNNPVVGFDVLEEGSQGGGDDTALNRVDLYCKDGGYVSATVNTGWGSWKPKQICPAGFAVMGIRTQVEEKQDGGDDTALNGVELYCKPYP